MSFSAKHLPSVFSRAPGWSPAKRDASPERIVGGIRVGPAPVPPAGSLSVRLAAAEREDEGDDNPVTSTHVRGIGTPRTRAGRLRCCH